MKNARLTLRIPTELREALDELAKAERRGLSNYVEAKLWEVVERARGAQPSR